MKGFPASSIPRHFSKEFKLETIRLLEQGRSLCEVARLMSVSQETLGRWHREANIAEEQTQQENAIICSNRNAYDEEFIKRALAKLDQGINPTKVAKRMGVTTQMLKTWKNKSQKFTHLNNQLTSPQLTNFVQPDTFNEDLQKLPTIISVLFEKSQYLKTAELLKSMAHPIRMKIILLLAEYHSMDVTSIQRSLHINKATLIPHLLKLREGGILLNARQGKKSLYCLPDSSLDLQYFLKLVLRFYYSRPKH